jgi:hypothetical protein
VPELAAVRVALLAACWPGAAVDEPGALVADAAPRRSPGGIDFLIRAVGRYVAFSAAVEAFHSKFRLSHFRAYYTVTVRTDIYLSN